MNSNTYTASATNPKSCYGSINYYGNNIISNVISPQPVITNPQIFCKFKPHSMPSQVFVLKPSNCSPYVKLGN